MRALVWHGKKDVRVEQVPDPVIKDPRDAIVRITSTAICGSDLHLYHHLIPTLEDGDILGHEFMGEIVEVGSDVRKLKVGDRVIVPFVISCGTCEFCQKGMTSLCDLSNPNAGIAKKAMGYSPAGLYGYTHMFGGYCGGQAELVRVPFADTSIFVMPPDIPDEQLLFLTDIFPTGWMAADNADIPPGGTVAIWGAGPVGQFAIKSAFLQGAGRVISVDDVPERLEMAKAGGAEVINFKEHDRVYEILLDMTQGKGPDAVIDAVGMEAHGHGGLMGAADVYDKAKQAVGLETDRPTALRQLLYCAKKGSTVSLAGVYAGALDKFPLGIAFNKGLTFRMGQTPVQRYVPELLKLIQDGKIDPSFVITHPLSLDEAARGYEIFANKEDRCIKVVLKP